MANSTISTQCCIAGGGPAGMMFGFLLARAGVDVVVLEKHADFFRDFRGDTVHPSTLEVMVELGLINKFLQLPLQKVETLSAQIGAEHVEVVDFRHLPTHCKFIALTPQWNFLNFLAQHGKRYPTFDLRMQAEATDLIEENGRVVGLIAKTPDGTVDDPRGPRGRRRLTPFDRARESRLREQGLRGADGCALVPIAAQRRGQLRHVRPYRGRQDDDHVGPRRLLAVRLHHPERRH